MRSSPRALLPMFGLLAACSGEVDLDTAGEVRGVVTDAETGAPLAGVVVQTAPATERVTTDAEGAYVLRAQLGVRYQVSAALDGYAPASAAFTPRVSAQDPLDFALELVRICTPGARRCVQGDEVPAVQTCGPRGNLWTSAPCAEGQGCDPAEATCKDLRKLTIILDAPGGVVRSEPVEGQPDAVVNCGNDCVGYFFAGTFVRLIATPHARSEFVRWRSSFCGGSVPVCELTLGEVDGRVAASFSASAFGLEVRAAGAGEGRITSAPEGIDCGDTCDAIFDRDTSVTLTAVAEPGSVFARWEQDCSDSGSNPTCTLTFDENKQARARFVPEGVALEVLRAGTGAGAVTSSPAGIDCGSNCLSTFEDGATVTLTASAAAGSTFTGWSGDCSGTDLTCDVVTDAPRTVTATFDGVAREVVVELGGRGRVTSSPAGIDCGATCAASFAAGAQVVLTAAADPGSVFAGWGLDCAGAGLAPTCTLAADADRRARADFVPYYLARLAEDGACLALLHLDAAAPAEVRCGASPGVASIVGAYAEAASRVAALGEARVAQGADEQGYIDTGRLGAPGPTATYELTVRKDGPAFEARGRAALISDVDLSDPSAAGLRLLLLDDGTLAVSTRDGSGGTSTASSAVAAVGDGTWYHVAATVDPTAGLGLFVDGIEVARTPGPVAWTASSSTAWVGAEREGSGDPIHRLDGAVDEVRVSDVVRY